MQSGLYIVGTPIGNLGDMSPRAVETLRAADLIACEDTRVFGKLASHFDIKTRRIAFHEHNEREMAAGIADMIAGRRAPDGAQVLEGMISGAAVALVSDSGMPTISDPGFRLVRECRTQGLPVFVVPGPVAAVSALALSGFPTDRFTFCGFFKDEKHLREDNRIRHTLVYYESPARAADTIALMARVMPERRIAVVREITKLHEETVIGFPAEILRDQESGIRNQWRGEIVIVAEPAPDVKMSDDEIAEIVRDVVGTRGNAPAKSVAAEISARTGLSKSEAYEMVVKE